MRFTAKYAHLALVPALSIALVSCGLSNKIKGGAIGAAAGGAAGALIGHYAADNTAVGAIIGAAVGEAAGVAIGHYMDKQAEEMRNDIEGAQIERVGEGIKITFDSGILFEVGSATVGADGQANIEKLAAILNKYDDTDILVEGHTDSDGAEAFNQTLSEQRATSVTNLAKGLGVAAARITMLGYGESQPVASNDTAVGKAQNRRVEVAIMANDDLKAAAERGEIDRRGRRAPRADASHSACRTQGARGVAVVVAPFLRHDLRASRSSTIAHEHVSSYLTSVLSPTCTPALRDRSARCGPNLGGRAEATCPPELMESCHATADESERSVEVLPRV